MAPEKICVECGEALGPRRRKLCGSESCRKSHAARVQREWQDRYREEHGHSSTKKYHSRPDYREKQRARTRELDARRPSARERMPARYALQDATRRMLIELAGELFDPVEIYDRDGWVCQLCGESVDRSLQYPDSYSVSLDHVLPLSRGGVHTRKNSQTAHLRCNIIKGNH